MFASLIYSQLGLKADINLSNFKADNYDSQIKSGFNFGLLYHYQIGKKFSVQPQLN